MKRGLRVMRRGFRVMRGLRVMKRGLRIVVR
jgi:hypothetical protein